MRLLYIVNSSFNDSTSAMLRNKAVIRGILSRDEHCRIDIVTWGNESGGQFAGGRSDRVNFIYLKRVAEGKRNEPAIKKRAVLFNLIKSIWYRFSAFDSTYFQVGKVRRLKLPCDEYDYVISSSDPVTSHLVAANIVKGKIRCGKWIQYWGDPLLNDIACKSSCPEFMIKKTERRILKKADKIVYVSPVTCERQKEIYPESAGKMFCCPIPYIESVNYPVNRERLKANKPHLLYSGAYKSNVRDITALYQCALRNNSLSLYIIGDSDLQLEEAENILIRDRLPREKLVEYEKTADIFVCIMNKRGTQIPGKIFHAAATNRPILVIEDGDCLDEIKEFLSQFNRFIFCKNSVEDIQAAIDKISKMEDDFHPLKELDASHIAGKILE